jgi:hypothetical protein
MNSTGTSQRRRRERHQPSRHRGQGLVRRQDNRLPFIGNRDRPKRLLVDGELEGRGQIVKRDELLIGDERDRHRAAAVPGQQPERGRGLRLARKRRGQQSQKRSDDGGGEKGM